MDGDEKKKDSIAAGKMENVRKKKAQKNRLGGKVAYWVRNGAETSCGKKKKKMRGE